jgi:hypothetical protein
MQSWSEVGGPSTIEWIGNGQIVIAQTTKGHEAIRKLLQDVRDGRHKIPISEPRRSADGAPFIRSQNGGVPSNN